MKPGWLNKKIIYKNFPALALTQAKFHFFTMTKSDLNSNLTIKLAIALNTSMSPPEHDIYNILGSLNQIGQILPETIVSRKRIQNSNQKCIAKKYYSCSLPPFLNP